MTDDEILARQDFIEQRLLFWRGRMTELQATCLHASTVYVPHSQSGYAELTIYWYDCSCKLCGKRWKENQ
jgi:hypothetical protein